jgi:ribosomal protein S18 acetylase RimI-like enzyme
MTSTRTGEIIQLNDTHRALIHQLRNDAERWLGAKGLDQYRGVNAPYAHRALDRLLDAGQFVGWEVDHQIRAVAAITAADLDFWTVGEALEPVTYLARFMVGQHGKGWGEILLEAIASRETARGSEALRLDCWRSNTGLHRYYEQHGFRHVRTVVVPGRQSGALFERRLVRTPIPAASLRDALTEQPPDIQTRNSG